MDDKFLLVFEKLSSINISLYLKEKDIMETENVISYLKGNENSPVDKSAKFKTLRSYTRLLKNLKKKQKKEMQEYNIYHQKFLGYVNECSPEELRAYAQELTKREHKFRDDILTLEKSSSNPVELQRLKVVAKSYYDSIEAIYQYIDMKLQFTFKEPDIEKELKKTTI